MKRISHLWLLGFFVAGILITLAGAQSQSLGDYARTVRKEKKSTGEKHYDNDNLPRTDKLSVVGNPAPEPDAAEHKDQAPADEQQKAVATDEKKDEKSAKDAADKADAKEKQGKEWQKKIADQRQQVDLLTRELDVLQREYRLRAAAMYADAGNRMRNQASWDKEDAQYKQRLADKQKAVDDAKQQVEDLQEQARKAGAPASMRE
jgi:hypothetical protein